MADILLVLAVEQVSEDMVGRQRADRQRGDEVLRCCGHDGTDQGATLAQPADEVERLVGGNTASDDQQDALSRECHSAPSSHGLTIPTPQSANSFVFRVTTRKP